MKDEYQTPNINLTSILLFKNRILDLAENEHIEGLERRMLQASKNYQLVYSKKVNPTFNMSLIHNSLKYGLDTITLEIQKQLIYRDEANENDYYHKNKEVITKNGNTNKSKISIK